MHTKPTALPTGTSLLDGRVAAKAVQQDIKQQTEALLTGGQAAPHLAIVLIGHHPASHTYVRAKQQACQATGLQYHFFHYPAIREDHLLGLIDELNDDDTIHGVIVQLPLPPNIHVERIIQRIRPEKDVDGLHALNYGRMACGLPGHMPATPLGIVALLQHYQVPTQGKHCVVMGRSRTVGQPLSILMSQKRYPGNATVTLCHSHTQNLGVLTCQADILVAAVGQPGLITAPMVKPGAVVVDVGITRVPDKTRKLGYRLQGDVDFEKVAPRSSYITPVPGGVGPMTIAALLQNTLQAAQAKK